jgi:hypothetical protein
MTYFNLRLGLILLLWLIPFSSLAQSGEAAAAIPGDELTALDRAINRELNTGSLGSQTLGLLVRLRSRIARFNSPPAAATSPEESGESLRLALRQELEGAVSQGGRGARRDLAFYYLFLNDPEAAREQWNRLGRAGELDLLYPLVSAFIDLTLGERQYAGKNLESTLAVLAASLPLRVSPPVFCQSIAAFRVYAPRPGEPFLPGEDALLYVEIEGARFSDSSEGGSECQLRFGLKLRDDNQGTVWAEPDFGEYAPLFNGPIHDLHAALTWKIPHNLEAGRYHLTVEALERSSNRRGEGVVAFSVAKRPTNPEKGLSASPAALSFPPDAARLGEVFPGAPLPVLPGGGSGGNLDQQKYDLLQKYYGTRQQP